MLLDSIKLTCIIFVCALHLSYVCLFACVYFGSSRVDDGSNGNDEYDYYIYFRLCFQARLTGEHFHLLTCYIQYIPMHTYVLCLPRICSYLRYLSNIHLPASCRPVALYGYPSSHYYYDCLFDPLMRVVVCMLRVCGVFTFC